MPDFYYDLAARLSNDRRVAIACVAFGFLVTPLLAMTLARGQLYGGALMAASWWLVAVLWWFHPQRRSNSIWLERWFYTLVLDFMALGVVFILSLAISKGEPPSF